jgi:C-5 cytosine-specific DNA methylase
MATKAAQRARIHRLVNIQFGGDGILEEDRHGNVAGVSDTESDSDDDLNFYDSSDDDNEDDAQRAKDSNQESRNPIIAVHDGRDDDDMFVGESQNSSNGCLQG